MNTTTPLLYYAKSTSAGIVSVRDYLDATLKKTADPSVSNTPAGGMKNGSEHHCADQSSDPAPNSYQHHTADAGLATQQRNGIYIAVPVNSSEPANCGVCSRCHSRTDANERA